MFNSFPFPRFVLLSVCLAAVTFSASHEVAGLVSQAAALPDDGYPSAAVHHTGQELTVNGLIVSGTVHMVRRELETAPVQTLRLWSAGGTTPSAIALARSLASAHTQVFVGPGAVCSSACVILLAEMPPDLRRLDSGAILRIHGSDQAAPSDEGMSPWIRRLSAPWFQYLADCPSKPLAHDAGLAMTWSEVQAIDQGHTIDCGRIAYRTKDWLFNRYPPPGRI